MSYHQEQLNSFLKKEIAIFLEKFIPKDEGVFWSVTRVEADTGLEEARVSVSLFPEKKLKEEFKKLKSFERGARKYIAPKLRRHKLPKIKFVLDETQKSEVNLEKLLDNIKGE